MGTKQAVVETWRNLIAVGADPLAITDNLNFGNPERPEVMGQFVGAIAGMGEACRVARLPRRVGQRVALQRDQRRRHPADTGDRRRRSRARHRAHGDLRLKGERRPADRHRPRERPPRPVALSGARDRQARGRTAAGRPRRRDQGRQSRARADPRGQGRGRARCLRRRATRRGRRDGARGRHRRGAVRLRGQAAVARHLVRRGPGPLRAGASIRCGRGDCWSGRGCLALPARIIGRTGGEGLRFERRAGAAARRLRTAHEAWLPSYMAESV